MKRVAMRGFLIGATVLVVSVVTLAGQQPAQRPALTAADSQFDQAAVDRGRDLLVNQCGFCHGSNARGGSSGPDLTRSEVVQNDEGGKELAVFLRNGRPDKGMPSFELSSDQVKELATFLHAAIFLNANRRLYQVLDIIVGDPKAGEAYFAGAGKCSSCHSATGDLKGVGGRYDPVTLQGKILMPRSGRGDGPPKPGYLEKNAARVTVTLPSKQVIAGVLVRLTDFDVTLYDAATSQIRSWARNGDIPKIEIVDPLQAHIDVLTRWTDADMHNVTAYLAGLK
ncbi:MAG TPA: c-type cytochrome [Vicinamibacterales bacterium]|nr:c-type cytochrome [Vicinamibacterales bacterium]